MVYQRHQLETIVLGTLLNDSGRDGFFDGSRNVLREELFSDRRNAFIFGLIARMKADGERETTPYDILKYAKEKKIRYGDTARFCTYMCELSRNYAFDGFKKYVRQLVEIYVKEKRYG